MIGHSVTLTLTSHDDNYSGDPTGTYYDDVVVNTGTTCTPPAAPTGVTASSSSQTAASVSWSASTGATSYSISRSTTSGGPYTSVGTSTSTSFADSGLACGTTYYYVVSASNGTCSSGNSAQASVATAACTTITNPFLNPGFEAGALTSWTASGAATGASTTQKHGGSYSARLGSTTATNGDSTITQTVTMPAGSSKVTFWYYVQCPDTVTYDWFTATLKDNTSNTTTTVVAKTCTNAGTWAQATASATAGHSVTLTLTSHDDNYSSDPTVSYVDDVNVQ
jgi:serine protease